MITLDQVSKCYRLYRRPSHRLLEMLTGRRGRWGDEFWALRDVTMSVGEG
jgi:ABC-type polysaccharide/polyol phosphate transport system ATPase subunit